MNVYPASFNADPHQYQFSPHTNSQNASQKIKLDHFFVKGNLYHNFYPLSRVA